MSLIPYQVYINFLKSYERPSDIILRGFFNSDRKFLREYTENNRKRWEHFKCLTKVLFIKLFDMESKHIQALYEYPPHNFMVKCFFNKVIVTMKDIMSEREYCPRILTIALYMKEQLAAKVSDELLARLRSYGFSGRY